MTSRSLALLALGATRAAVGLGTWLAPDLSAQFFGLPPARGQRFVMRLFGVRELTLAVTLLAAPPEAVRKVAALGAAIDLVDAVAGLDERRRGNLNNRATLLGPVGALAFASLGALIVRDSRSAP